MNLASYVRDIPNFPQQGILFRDITPLLKDPTIFDYIINSFLDYYSTQSIDVVAGIESRGFLFATPLAMQLGKPMIPVRKEGKLPYKTNSARYSLEYGEGVLEIHTDAIDPGQRVLIVDDLLATGGTIQATADLIRNCGGILVGIAVLIELTELNGRDKLRFPDLFSLIKY